MTRKKLTALIAALAVTAVSVFSAVLAFADDVSWHYDSTTDTLYITGSGNMDDYESTADIPWCAHLQTVHSVVVEDGVTGIGKRAFASAGQLTDVTLTDSVTAIGENAFASCPNLNSLTLGENIVSIAGVSFAYNGNTEKPNFALYVTAGSYALDFAYRNDLNFVCEDVRTGTLHVSLQKGMIAYFPYTCKYSGNYRFYSVSKHDSLGYIYRSDKTQLAYNDDHSTLYHSDQGSTDFGLTASLTQGERYYLAVKIFNPSLKAKFDVYFEPVSYTVSGTLYAMNSPDGDASSIVLTNATMDGVATNNGAFTKTVNGLSETVTFACDGVTLEHTFSVDDGDNIVIPMMMCDVNGDGIVNARDYAIMLRGNSPYVSLFENFMNYRC